MYIPVRVFIVSLNSSSAFFLWDKHCGFPQLRIPEMKLFVLEMVMHADQCKRYEEKFRMIVQFEHDEHGNKIHGMTRLTI